MDFPKDVIILQSLDNLRVYDVSSRESMEIIHRMFLHSRCLGIFQNGVNIGYQYEGIDGNLYVFYKP